MIGRWSDRTVSVSVRTLSTFDLRAIPRLAKVALLDCMSVAGRDLGASLQFLSNRCGP